MRLDADNKIWLDLEDLRHYGLYDSYKKWLNRNTGEVVIQNKEVMYESMPKRSQSKVSRDILLAEIGCEEARAVQMEAIKPEIMVQFAVAEAMKGDWRTFYPYYEKEHKQEVAMELAKAASMVQAVIDFISDPVQMGRMKQTMIVHLFFKELQKRCSDYKYLKLTNENYFIYHVLKPSIPNKVTQVIVQPRKGNTYAGKATAWHLYAIRRLYADPKQYSKTTVHEMLNWIISDMELEEIGFKQLAQRTVMHLIDQKMENEVSPWRMGMKHFNDHQRGYISRQGALFPGDLWLIDGTRIQRMYELGGRVYYAYEVFVMDAYSGAKIGSCMLKAGQGESRWAVAQALKVAAKITGYLPAELLSDNSSAVKNAETDGLLDRLGIKVRHSKVGNAKDKIIERMIRTVQTRCDKLYDNNTGEGIRSKVKNAFPSPEHIAEVRKKGNIPTFEGLILQQIEETNIYNNHKWNDKASCMDKLRKTESPHVVRLEAWELAQLFWFETEVTVRSRQITFNVQGEAREYWIWENRDAAALNNTKVKVKYELHDRELVYLFDLQDNYLCECKPKKKPAMATINQTEDDRLQYIKQTAHLETHLDYLEEVNQKIREEGETLIVEALAVKMEADITAAEEYLAIVAPFSDAKNTHKRFKDDINNAEAQLMTSVVLDEHGINYFEAERGLRPMKDTSGMNPLEDGYETRREKRKKKSGNIYETEGDMSVVE